MSKGNVYDWELLKENFKENNVKFCPASFDEIEFFQNKYDVKIPQDLRNYYSEINGSGNEILSNLYKFYNIYSTKKVKEELVNFRGVPDYSQLNFEGMENIFVFGESDFCLYAFGIELYQNSSYKNRIFIFCGGDFKIIAESFTEFIDLYLTRPEEIHI